MARGRGAKLAAHRSRWLPHQLNAPADQLIVTDGIVHAKSDATKKRLYADLIGGRYFNVQLEWNKQIGNTLYAPGKAKPKDPKDYKIVGQPIKRADIAPKVFAQEPFVTDVKMPGMVHARMIRPPVAGAAPVKVDEASIKDIPGARWCARTTSSRVVADKEWDAIKACQNAKVEWSDAKPPFPTRRRSTTTSARRRCASARTSSRSATSTRRSRPRRA